MSTNNSQQTPSDAGKTCRCPSIASLIIWIVLLLIIGAVLWVCFTEGGQQTLGNIANKGPVHWLLGEGDAQAENDAAAELEKCGIIVIKEGDRGVTSISFDNCPKPGDETLKQISKLFHLSSVNLSSAEINDDQLAYLSKLHNLNNILLNGTSIGDAGLVFLVDLPVIQNFQANNTNVTDKGLEHIVKLLSLKILDLSHTKVTDRGMSEIAKLKNINWLLLKGNNITDAGLAELASITELKRLTLSNDMKISKEAIEQLKKAIPKLSVDWDRPDPPFEKPTAVTPPAAEAENQGDKAKP